MTHLVLPAAGASTRFALHRPKFLLTHPSGKTMLEASIEGLGNLEHIEIEKILIVTLKEYFKQIDEKLLCARIKEQYGVPTEILLLNKPTKSSVETLRLGLSDLPKDSSIIIKDIDNTFNFSSDVSRIQNYVAFANIQKNPNFKVANKAFIKFSPANQLLEISEKKVVSENFYVGLLKCNKVQDFLNAARTTKAESEIHVSHVIRTLLKHNIHLRAIEVENYFDWGTKEDWFNYCKTFSTLFVDLDGVVFENLHELNRDYNWQKAKPIWTNCETLLQMSETSRVKIVFLSARPNYYLEMTKRALMELGFSKFEIILGLTHSQRILINDFSETNPYPTAKAINLPRNSDSLKSYLN